MFTERRIEVGVGCLIDSSSRNFRSIETRRWRQSIDGAGAALCARAASLGHVDALRELGQKGEADMLK